jgi:iron complex transport system permease protein
MTNDVSVTRDPAPVAGVLPRRPVVRRPVVRLAGGRVALKLHVRGAAVGTLLFAAALAVAVLALSTGELSVPVADVLASLTGQADAGTDFVVRELRLPRVLAGLLVGAALGVSGAIFQSLTRNPLGSPDIVGLTLGASTGALVVILVFQGSGPSVAAGAVAGCLATAVAVWLLAFRRGGQTYRLILMGVGVAALLEALNSFLIVRARLDEALSARVWLVGSLNSRTWTDVAIAGVALGLLLPVALRYGGRLRMLSVGDELAALLGVPVGRTRAVLAGVGVVLAAAATAAAGPVGFVALAAPQLAARLTRSPGPGLLPAAAMGALLLVTSDWVAQRALTDVQLPVGVVTGALGGTYLTWLLAREWRRGRTVG